MVDDEQEMVLVRDAANKHGMVLVKEAAVRARSVSLPELQL